MLRELRVVGYRSLREVDLPLSPLTVVVGANGSGKTNLYQALQLLSSAAQGSLAQSLAAQGGLPSAMWAGPRRKQEGHRIELGIDLEDLAYELQLGVIPPPQGAFKLDPDVIPSAPTRMRRRGSRRSGYAPLRSPMTAAISPRR